MVKNVKWLNLLGGCNFLAGKYLRFAGMVIHNPKVGGSIPPPATNGIMDLGEASATGRFLRVANLCTTF